MDTSSDTLNQFIDGAIFSALHTDARSITFYCALALAFEGLVLGAVLTETYRYFEHFGRRDSIWTLLIVTVGVCGCLGQFGLNLWQTYMFIDKAATAFYLVLEKDIYADMTVLLLVGIYQLAGDVYFARKAIKLVGHTWLIGIPLGALSLTSFAMCIVCVASGFNIPWTTLNIVGWLSKINTYVITWTAVSLTTDLAVCAAMMYALLKTRNDIEAAATSLYRKLFMLMFETLVPPAIVVFVLLTYGSVKGATFGNFTRALAWLIGPLYYLAVVHSLVSRHDVQFILQTDQQNRPPVPLSGTSSEQAIRQFVREKDYIEDRQEKGQMILPMHMARAPGAGAHRRRESETPVPMTPVVMDERAKKMLGFADDDEFGINLA
ncbi:hypothetical protein IAT38_001972 [Cryptococcus sp. DSM 104549]